MTISLPNHLSFSALSTYIECGTKYQLSRGFHRDKSTWRMTILGKAIHKMTELAEMGEEIKAEQFHEFYAGYLQKELDNDIEVKSSGRKGTTDNITWTGGPNKRDAEWVRIFGPQIYEAFRVWRAEHDELEALKDADENLIGIELGFEVEIGSVPIKGFIDRVFVNKDTGHLLVIDYKAGSPPKSNIQLDTYAVGLKRALGLEVDFGGFLFPYWSKTNKRVEVNVPEWHYLATVSENYLDYLYSQARKGIEADIFLPSPSQFCQGCAVRDYCRAQDGVHALKTPVWNTIEIRPPEDDIASTEEEEEVPE